MTDPSRAEVTLPYRETVRGSWLLLALIAVAGFATLAGGVAAALDASATGTERTLVPLAMVLVAIVLAFVGVTFSLLRIEVDIARLRWSFGPFGKSVPVIQIATAQAEPYRWIRFGGWAFATDSSAAGGARIPSPSRCAEPPSSFAMERATT